LKKGHSLIHTLQARKLVLYKKGPCNQKKKSKTQGFGDNSKENNKREGDPLPDWKNPGEVSQNWGGSIALLIEGTTRSLTTVSKNDIIGGGGGKETHEGNGEIQALQDWPMKGKGGWWDRGGDLGKYNPKAKDSTEKAVPTPFFPRSKRQAKK